MTVSKRSYYHEWTLAGMKERGSREARGVAEVGDDEIGILGYCQRQLSSAEVLGQENWVLWPPLLGLPFGICKLSKNPWHR